MSSSYHYHKERQELIAVIRGRGEIIIEGVTISLYQGVSITIPRGKNMQLGLMMIWNIWRHM